MKDASSEALNIDDEADAKWAIGLLTWQVNEIVFILAQKVDIAITSRAGLW